MGRPAPSSSWGVTPRYHPAWLSFLPTSLEGGWGGESPLSPTALSSDWPRRYRCACAVGYYLVNSPAGLGRELRPDSSARGSQPSPRVSVCARRRTFLCQRLVCRWGNYRWKWGGCQGKRWAHGRAPLQCPHPTLITGSVQTTVYRTNRREFIFKKVEL
jgi:hypothetical protein